MNKIVYHNILLISFLGLIFGSQSCYKDKFDFSNINDTAVLSPNMGIPVASGELSFSDLVKEKKDTLEYYHEGSDPQADLMVRLVYNIDTISKYKASEFLKPPLIEPVTKTVQLGVLAIDNQNSDTSITFTKFVSDNCASGDVAYYSGLKSGDPVATKYGTQYPPYILNKFGGIAWVYTLTGDVKMTLTNYFDVPLSCKVTLQTDLSLIGEGTQTIGTFDFTGTPIAPGTSATKTISVNGYKISSTINYKYSDVTLGAKASGPVGMSKKLYTALQLANLKVTAGKASLPSQSLNRDTLIWFTIDTYKAKKLTQLDVYKGVMNFNITSKIPGLYISLSSPAILKNGDSLKTTFNFSSAGKISKDFDLSGYSMKLATNPKQRYNSLPIRLKFGINSNGQQVSFNETNEFSVTMSNKDSLQFEYVEGNMGHDTLNLANSNNGKNVFNFKIDEFMDNYFTGKVTFTDPKLTLNFVNSIGMSASTNLQLTGMTKDGSKLPLFTPPVPFKKIDRPGVRGAVVESNISITKDNSNVVSFLDGMPHTVMADGTFITNKDLNDNQIVNFITRQSYVSAQLHAELPLKFSMQDLVLRKDYPLSPSKSATIDSLQGDDQFKIIFYAKNQFPVDVTVKLTLIDSISNKVLDTLTVALIKAAPTTQATGKVERSTQIKWIPSEIILSKDKNPKMVQNFMKANKLRFEAKLNTYGQESITIYTYYTIAFELCVDAKVKYKKSLGIKK